MRAVCQRVSEAHVTVDGVVRGAIGRGLVVLLGVADDDDVATAEHLAAKVARLRIFAGTSGRFEQDVRDVAGTLLVVSQFTLVADTRKGNRPSFTHAAAPEHAEKLYDHFCGALRAEGVPVETGEFGARMAVALVNDGPVTIVLDTA